MYPHDKLDWTLSRLERTLESAPDDADTRLDYAVASLSRAWFHDGGESWFNRALTQARRVLQEEPASLTAQVVAGTALVGLDRLEAARRYLDQAQAQNERRGDLALALGWMSRTAGDPIGALEHFEDAARLAPDSWEAHAMVARALREAQRSQPSGGRYNERAQFHAVKALELSPSGAWRPRLLRDLAVSCLESGRLEQARRLFVRLEHDHEEHKAEAQYFLGLVAYRLGKYKNAVLHFRQHMQATEEHPSVLARIALAHLQLQDARKAREACHRALALDPDHLQARWALGCALVEEDRTDEALREFKEVLERDPGHLPAFQEVVRLRKKLGDTPWLKAALRAEVGGFDRLPLPTGGRDPRAATLQRLGVLAQALVDVDPEAAGALLGWMDLTEDESARFMLWEAALGHEADRRADEAAGWLEQAGNSYSAERGRTVLTLASVLPEPLLTQGLDLKEEHLRRAAVERWPQAHDVQSHRDRIEQERHQARAWQALLLLAISSRGSTAGRNLLLRWASDADGDLGLAARVGLALQGDASALLDLRETPRAQQHAVLIDALAHVGSPPGMPVLPRTVSDDESVHCSTCGRRATEVSHLLAGNQAVICEVCIAEIDQQREFLETDDPSVPCRLCGRTLLTAPSVYLFRGATVCGVCVDNSTGLAEREAVDRFLTSW